MMPSIRERLRARNRIGQLATMLFFWMSGLSPLFAGGQSNERQNPLIERSALADDAGESIEDWRRLRLLFVPRAELAKVMEGENQRVVMDRQQVETLLKDAQRAEAQRQRAAVSDFRWRGPEQFVWERASYRLELSSETARLFGTVNGQAMGSEPLSLPLPWAGGLIHRLLQNEGPPIWYTGTMGAHRPIVEPEPTDKPSWQLLLLQPGDYAFDLDMTLPVESDAVRQTVRFHWPATTRTQLQAEVPGNVELVSGAAVLQRSYNAESDTTGFELAVGGAEVELIFTLNNRQKSQERLWDARTWTNAVVTPTLDRFEVVLEPQVLQGQLDSARWEFPENVEISDVGGEGVRQWRVDSSGPSQWLEIDFHADLAEQPIRLVAFRQRLATREPFEWSAPRWLADGAYRQPGLLVVQVTPDVVVPEVKLTGYQPVPRSLLRGLEQQRRPDNIEQPSADFGRGLVVGQELATPVGAWYAADRTAALELACQRAPDRFDVIASHFVALGPESVDGRSVFQLENVGDLRFQVQLKVPAGFKIRQISDSQGVLTYRVGTSEDGETVDVDLRQGIGGVDQQSNATSMMPGTGSISADGQGTGTAVTSKMDLIVEGWYQPEDWLSAWKTRPWIVKPVEVQDAVPKRSVIALRVDPTFTVSKVETTDMTALGRQQWVETELSLLEPDMAFDYAGSDGRITLELERRTAQTTARSISFYRFEPTRVLVRGEIEIEVQHVPTDRFQLRLPPEAPASLRVISRGAVNVRQQSRSEEDPELWTVQLEHPVLGTVPLEIDYELPVTLTPSWVGSLAAFGVEGPELQTRLLSIEGHPRLECEIRSSSSQWASDQLPATRYQPGRRLLGVWDLSDPQATGISVTVSSQALEATPRAVVEQAKLQTIIAVDGRTVTKADYQLKTMAGLMVLSLPEGSRLWSLLQNDEPQTVQHVGDSLLISFASSQSEQTQRVTVVYDSREVAFSGDAERAMRAPTWWFEGSEVEDRDEVPVLRTEWTVQPPPGWEPQVPPSDWDVKIERPPATWWQRQAAAWRGIADLWPWSMQYPSVSAQPSDSSVAEWFEADSAMTLDMPMERSGALAGMAGEEPRQRASEEKSVDRAKLKAQTATLDDELSRGVAQNRQSLVPAAPAPSSGAVPTPARPTPRSELGLKGFRSLQIVAEQSGNAYQFASLGSKRDLGIQWTRRSDMNQWTVLVLALTLALGLAWSGWTWRSWIVAAALVAFGAAAAPLALPQFPWAQTLAELLFWVCLGLAVWHGLRQTLGGWLQRCRVRSEELNRDNERAATNIQTGTTAILLLALGLVSSGTAVPSSQAAVAIGETRVQEDDRRVDQGPPIKVPAEAILIPYDPDRPGERLQGPWLFPKAWYDRLIAERDAVPPRMWFPQRGVLPVGELTLSVESEGTLKVIGRFPMDVPGTEELWVPLQVEGGALVQVTVDGQPVELWQTPYRLATSHDRADSEAPVMIVDNEGNPSGSGDQQLATSVPETTDAQPAGEKDCVWILLSAGQSRRIELEVRYPLVRSPGGWQVQGRLPSAVATSVAVVDLPGGSRVSWAASAIPLGTDAAFVGRNVTVPETGRVEGLGVGQDGQFKLRWRAAEATVSVGSAAVTQSVDVAIDPDQIRQWHHFSLVAGEATDEVTLSLPKEGQLERVEGENLRTWRIIDSPERKLLVQFLSPATQLNWRVDLVRPTGLTAGRRTIPLSFPKLDVAGRVAGRLRVFRSPKLELETTEAASMSRVNFQDDTPPPASWQAWSAEYFAAQPYQQFRWSAGEPKLTLEVNVPDQARKVTHRNVIHVDVARTKIESQIRVAATTQPLSQLLIRVPEGIQIEGLVSQQRKDEAWSTVPFDLVRRQTVDGYEDLEVRFHEFPENEVQVTLYGEWTVAVGQVQRWSPMQVVGAQSQSYDYALTSGESLELRLEGEVGVERVLPEEFRAWLQEERRKRLPLTFRAAGGEHEFSLESQRVVPLVTFDAITDLVVGDRVIAETILLEWNIQRSGINQVQFRLPSRWASANIEGPWIARVGRESAGEQETLFTVYLQDRIVGDYRVVASLDVPTSQSTRLATVPVNLTGETRNRWITVQNSGQSELSFDTGAGVEVLQRQRPIFSQLQARMNAPYLANAFRVDPTVAGARLQWNAVQRETVEVRTTRVRMSETDLTFDRNGAYIGKLRLQVNNRTLPELRVELPGDSSLVTLIVDGVPAQPLSAADVDRNVVIVPLVKSTDGSLDYPVDLIYQGRLPGASLLTERQMPLAKTLQVESEVSHVRVHLPTTLQPLWFGGTMSQVQSAEDLVQELREYQTKQILDFKQSVAGKMLSSGEQSRKRLELDNFLMNNALQGPTGGEALSPSLVQEIQGLDQVLSVNAAQSGDSVGNRAQLKELVVQQRNDNEFTLGENYRYNFVDPNSVEVNDQAGQLDGRGSSYARQGQQAQQGEIAAANLRLAEIVQADKARDLSLGRTKDDAYRADGEFDAGLNTPSLPSDPNDQRGRFGRRSGADRSDSDMDGVQEELEQLQAESRLSRESLFQTPQTRSGVSGMSGRMPSGRGGGMGGGRGGAMGGEGRQEMGQGQWALGLEPSDPFQPMNGPTGPPSLATPSRIYAGLNVAFEPSGKTYYFRVPRGQPELSIAWATQEQYVTLGSSAQLVGVGLGLLFFGLVARWVRARLTRN